MSITRSDITVSIGSETMELSAMIDGYLERRRYSGYSKLAAIRDFLNFYNHGRKESGVVVM